MIRSSLITPVRWYDDYNEQHRYSIDCDICDFQLITDKTRLLPFQIKRPKNPYQPARWFLRSACKEPFQNILNSNDSNFTIDTGFWSTLGYDFQNGKVIANPSFSLGYMRNLTALTIGKLYEIKIVVSEFVQALASSFDVTVSSNSVALRVISQPGTYVFSFTAAAQDIRVTSNSSNGTNYAVIDLIQVRETMVYDASTDIDLPLNRLNVINAGDFDLMIYCGGKFSFQIPCGQYYMIVYDLHNNAYYSEVITVKDFIPSQSPYVLLEWRNSCDVKDVIYNSTDCTYRNRLYIDGPISAPEYPITENGETDGNEHLNITFQKWEKKENLTVPKSPEFIVDSLSIIRLHDFIEITKPLRKKQLQVSSAYEVDKIEADISYIFSDCASNVKLSMSLKDKIIDSTCCVNIANTGCIPCDFIVEEEGVVSNGYYYGNPPGGGPYSIYEVTPGTPDIYTDVKFLGALVCVGSMRVKYYNSTWNVFPKIESATVEGGIITIIGQSYETAFVEVGLICDGSAMPTWLPGYYNYDQLTTGITLPDTVIPTGGCTAPAFVIRAFDLICDYGQSDPVTPVEL